MYTNIEERACDLAVYIIENRATVRSAATQFGISKSTVHADATKRNGSSVDSVTERQQSSESPPKPLAFARKSEISLMEKKP